MGLAEVFNLCLYTGLFTERKSKSKNFIPNLTVLLKKNASVINVLLNGGRKIHITVLSFNIPSRRFKNFKSFIN